MKSSHIRNLIATTIGVAIGEFIIIAVTEYMDKRNK